MVMIYTTKTRKSIAVFDTFNGSRKRSIKVYSYESLIMQIFPDSERWSYHEVCEIARDKFDDLPVFLNGVMVIKYGAYNISKTTTRHAIEIFKILKENNII